MTNEELVELYQNGDNGALDILTEQNKRVVIKIAHSFYTLKTNSIDIEDLIQEGYIGLIVAAKKYNPNMENAAKFITYAVFWIRQRMTRFITQKNTNDEVSLNTPIGEEEDAELIDTLKTKENLHETVVESIYNKQIKEELHQAMKEHITLKEREILDLNYGLDNKNPLTVIEIGDIFGVSHEIIRNTKAKAFRKLRGSNWGRAMAKELYTERMYENQYTFKGAENRANFSLKYFSLGVVNESSRVERVNG